MEKTFNIVETSYGYTLTNGSQKLVMNKSKIQGAAAKYFLKEVEPFENYITGLFYNKLKKNYRGKTVDGKFIFVRIVGGVAFINGL